MILAFGFLDLTVCSFSSVFIMVINPGNPQEGSWASILLEEKGFCSEVGFSTPERLTARFLSFLSSF